MAGRVVRNGEPKWDGRMNEEDIVLSSSGINAVVGYRWGVVLERW